MSEESKAIEAVANATKVGIEACGKFARFISKYIDGTLEQGIGIFEDKLKYYRWENQVKLMEKANYFLKEVGLKEPNQAIKLKFALPLLEAASMEDDDYLQDLWAKLLVNATNKESNIVLMRSYIDILERITPLEARILEKIYSIPFDKIQHIGVATRKLPEIAEIASENSNEEVTENDDLKLALANLARLGCTTLARTWGNGELFGKVNPTVLGKHFVEACTIKD